MNIQLYTSLVIAAIDSVTACSDAAKATLKNMTNQMTGEIPLYLNKESMDSTLTTWGKGLSVEESILPSNPGSLKQILKLHDGDFVAINSASAILQYSYGDSFVLQEALPFKFATVATTEYNNPGRCGVVTYDDTSGSAVVKNTLLLVPVAAQHVVQIYKWSGGRWSHLATLGTAASSGNTTGLLDTPVAASAYFDIATSKVHVAVSCSGAASTGEPSFIKEFEVTLAGAPTDKGEISNTIASGTGSLVDGQTSNIVSNIFQSNRNMWVLTTSLEELGEMDFNTSITFPNPVTNKVVKGDIKTLLYSDTLKSPSAFNVLGNLVVVGDARGHLAIMTPSLDDVVITIGQAEDTVNNTDYPLTFAQINDILILDEENFFFISGTTLYKTNLPEVTSQVVFYTVGAPLIDTMFKQICGIPGTVEVSLDGVTYEPVADLCCGAIPLGSNLYVKSTRSVAEVLTGDSDIPEGVVIVSI